MAKSVEDKVKEIIVEQLGVDEEDVTPSAKFIEDLGADSLDTVELVMALEEHFDVQIPDELRTAKRVERHEEARQHLDVYARLLNDHLRRTQRQGLERARLDRAWELLRSGQPREAAERFAVTD